MIRGLAALAVVVDHAIHMAGHMAFPGLLPWGAAADLIGETGVGAFFALSGAVMAGQTQDARGRDAPARRFLIRRVRRIVPMYWIATACALAVFASATQTPAHVLQSLLFIPYVSGSERPYPVLFQGWTLEYEMLFYLLCTASLLLRRTTGEALLLAGPCVLAVLHHTQPFAPGSEGAVLFNLVTDPMCLLFAAGVAAGSIQRRQPGSLHSRLLSYPALVLLAPMALAALMPGAVTATGHRIDVLGAAAGAGVVVICLFSRAPRLGSFGRLLVTLGGASYSTYLFHTMVLMLLLRALPALDWGLAETVTMLAAVSAFATACGLLLHEWLEKPIMRAMGGHPGPRTAAAGLPQGGRHVIAEP